MIGDSLQNHSLLPYMQEKALVKIKLNKILRELKIKEQKIPISFCNWIHML